LRVAVTGARHAGHSWEAIGRLLGVSRQAAQQRFAATADGGAGVPDGDDAPRWPSGGSSPA
jgi:hypothetical protein